MHACNDCGLMFPDVHDLQIIWCPENREETPAKSARFEDGHNDTDNEWESPGLDYKDEANEDSQKYLDKGRSEQWVDRKTIKEKITHCFYTLFFSIVSDETESRQNPQK